MDIPAYGERSLAKNLEENDKKFSVEPCRVGERERVFEKVVWTSQIWFFKNLIHEFRLIEKQFRLIETDRGFSKILKQFQNNFDWSKNRLDQSKQTEASLNNFKRISIDRKIDWINRNWQRLTKFEEKHSFWKKIQEQLKALKLMNKMHKYVMIWFSKTRI